MITPILQFGTSRFLQAHADLFISEALRLGGALGRITIVQTSGSAERARRLKALAAQEGFPVLIRGIESGKRVDRKVQVKSVARALSAASDWAEITRIACKEAKIFICNTADNGYLVDDVADLGALPASFPGKLLLLLHARYKDNGAALTILPTELIARNGETLKAIILKLAATRIGDPQFEEWLAARVVWASTLVDRIVSEPLEPAGAIAEPYALWAIEDQPGLMVPCVHPAIKVVPKLEPYEKLKLYILNLGHTVLADDWQLSGGRADLTVREYLADPDKRAALMAVYEDEIIPGFALRGMESEARAYGLATMERFENPSLNHRISDIIQNHAEKIRRRIDGFMTWSGFQPTPVLSRISERNRQT